MGDGAGDGAGGGGGARGGARGGGGGGASGDAPGVVGGGARAGGADGGDGGGGGGARRAALLIGMMPGHPFVRRLQESPSTRRVVENMEPEDFRELVRALKRKRPSGRRPAVPVSRLDDVVQLLARAQRVLVLTGAGISTSCGIPDFRSADGVYSMLDGYRLSNPQDLFSIHYFRRNTKPFYDFARKLWPGTHKPAPTHHFIRKLDDHGKLHRNYTQNIDTLEHVAGITKVLQCHGSFATATCTRCKYTCAGEEIKTEIMNRQAPLCPRCAESPQPSLMEEFALRDPDMRAFRVAGDRSMSMSSDSDSDSDAHGPAAAATGTAKASPPGGSASATPRSSAAPNAIAPPSVAPPAAAGPPPAPNSQGPPEAAPGARPKPTIDTSSYSSPTQPGGGHAVPMEPDSPFTSARTVFGGSQHTATGGAAPAAPLPDGVAIARIGANGNPVLRPQRRSNSLASDLEAMLPATPTFASSLTRTNSLSSSMLATPLAAAYPSAAIDAAGGIALSEDDAKMVAKVVISPLPGVKPAGAGADSAAAEPLLDTEVSPDHGSNHASLGVASLGGDDELGAHEAPAAGGAHNSVHAEAPGDGDHEQNAAAGADGAPPAPTREQASEEPSSGGREGGAGDDAAPARAEDDADAGLTTPRAKASESGRQLFGSIAEELPFVDLMYDRGVMKPDVVFFGESLPTEFFDSIEQDVKECDLVLVMGTSLKVAPVSHIIQLVDPETPQILVNRELVAQPHHFDAELLGNCDNVIAVLAARLGWDLGDTESAVPLESLASEFRQSDKRPRRFLFAGAQEDEDEDEDRHDSSGAESGAESDDDQNSTCTKRTSGEAADPGQAPADERPKKTPRASEEVGSIQHQHQHQQQQQQQQD